MITCPNCGTETTPGDRFCQACGYPVPTAGSSSPPPPPALDPGEWPDSGDPGLSMPIPMPPPPPPVIVPPGTPYPPAYPGYPSAPVAPGYPSVPVAPVGAAATPYLPSAPTPYAPPLPAAPLATFPASAPAANPSFAPYQPAPVPLAAPVAVPARTKDGPPAISRRVWIVVGVVLLVSLLAVYFATRGGGPTLAGEWYGSIFPITVTQSRSVGEAYLNLHLDGNDVSGNGATCAKSPQGQANFSVTGSVSGANVTLTWTAAAIFTAQFTGTWNSQSLNLTGQKGSTSAWSMNLGHGSKSEYEAACPSPLPSH